MFWVIWFTNRVFWVTNISIPPHRSAAKGLASYCKAETTFTFHFSILTLSNASLGINNREIKSESGISFVIASQPLHTKVRRVENLENDANMPSGGGLQDQVGYFSKMTCTREKNDLSDHHLSFSEGVANDHSQSIFPNRLLATECLCYQVTEKSQSL